MAWLLLDISTILDWKAEATDGFMVNTYMNGTFEDYYRQINLNPENRHAYLHLGDALHAKGRFAEAVAVYDRAISIWPGFGEAHNNRGNALLDMGHYREAIESYHRAVRFLPSFAEGHVTIATALQALHRPYEAMASCHRALAIDPDCAEAHWNLALALLQVGEYATGWDEFEWRWKKRGFTSRRRDFQQPAWDGSPLDGKTILIHAEQGFGDTFQFVRFVPLVAEMGGAVVVECPASMTSLLAGVAGASVVVAAGGRLPEFDTQLPVMSLPRVFGTRLETIPHEFPYIVPPLESIAAWGKRFSDRETLRVGLVWAGRKKPDPNRTCPFEYFSPLAGIPGVTYYSLQLENEMSAVGGTACEIKLVDLTTGIRDFCDTASLIAHLDLVISIDTGVAHLAGAMGKETWVILPHAADWRWMLDRDDSPWYPAMRLFRQKSPGNWPGVMAMVREALLKKLSSFAGGKTLNSSQLEDAYAKGLSYLQAGNSAAAKKQLCRALILNPHTAEVFNALGVLALKTGDDNTGLAFFRLAVAMDPAYVDGRINLGNALCGGDLLQDAVLEYRRAIEIAPDDVRAHQNLGVALKSLGMIAEAASSFEKALDIDPGYATARWNLAILKLLSGELSRGFEDFESRYLKIEPVPLRHAEYPPWDGSSFAGKTLLVHAEQGFGDTFQFVRYLPLVAERGGKVIFECQHESLRDLLAVSLRGTAFVYVRGETLPAFHFQSPLMSLPRIFGTTLESMPSSQPYLVPRDKELEKWRLRLQPDSGFRIGIVWAGRPKPDPKRSASLQAFAPLATVRGAIFYSLQVGGGSEQAQTPPQGMVLRDHSPDLTDFSETAALIANLDLVVTIDSAVAHLAGAMGKPVWVLLPHAPDWRWMLARNDCPWYPTMRLFRQESAGDWSRPLLEMKYELSALNVSTGD